MRWSCYSCVKKFFLLTAVQKLLKNHIFIQVWSQMYCYFLMTHGVLVRDTLLLFCLQDQVLFSCPWRHHRVGNLTVLTWHRHSSILTATSTSIVKLWRPWLLRGSSGWHLLLQVISSLIASSTHWCCWLGGRKGNCYANAKGGFSVDQSVTNLYSAVRRDQIRGTVAVAELTYDIPVETSGMQKCL